MVIEKDLAVSVGPGPVASDASGRQGVWLGGRLGGIPAAGTGVGPPAWRGHAADEFITLDHYHNGIKYAATIWALFGERHGGQR